MSILNLIGSISSIISLILCLFIVSYITKINKKIKVKGNGNITAGDNVHYWS